MKLRLFLRRFGASSILLLLVASAPSSSAQVSPAEVNDPQLKALESEYLQDLIKLNRQVSAARFPFTFFLSRYVDLDPKDQAGADTRGLEFVSFHDHTLLKFSGNYNAAFSARQMTVNQRADRVFSEVIAPVLRLLPQYFSGKNDFDGFGFEISYHVFGASGKANYEGRENLVVVMSLVNATRFPLLAATEERQNLINASQVYVSAQRIGLALGQPDPVPLGELAKSESGSTAYPSSSNSGIPPLRSATRVAGVTLDASPQFRVRPDASDSLVLAPSTADSSPMIPADVDVLQAKYQSILNDFGSFVGVTMREKNPSSPTLALFRKALYLQLTLRNPETFDRDKTSLYKRAALSFDIFLAPHLADLSTKIPNITNLSGLDITVLVSLTPSSTPSEAVEFIFPLETLRRFAAYDISNQDLIDKGMVIVNGVRVSLSLQQVE